MMLVVYMVALVATGVFHLLKGGPTGYAIAFANAVLVASIAGLIRERRAARLRAEARDRDAERPAP